MTSVDLQTRSLSVGVSPKEQNVNSFPAAGRYSARKFKSNLGSALEIEILPVLFLLAPFFFLFTKICISEYIMLMKSRSWNKSNYAGITRKRKNWCERTMEYKICSIVWILYVDWPRIIRKRFAHLKSSIFYFFKMIF